MTRQRYLKLPCPSCGAEIDPSSPFSGWLRDLPYPLNSDRISNQNLDYVWHNYRERWFITIEEKQHGGECSFAQQDTHSAVAQLLSAASGTVIETARGPRPVEYRGHYVVRFADTTPDDSAWVVVNRHVYSDPSEAVRWLLIHGSQPDACTCCAVGVA